jgi:hypothetical protein
VALSCGTEIRNYDNTVLVVTHIRQFEVVLAGHSYQG